MERKEKNKNQLKFYKGKKRIDKERNIVITRKEK